MNSIPAAASRYTLAGLARPLLVTAAFVGAANAVIATASADNLTAEQRALVEKYKISEADQKVLFGSPAPAANTGGPEMPRSGHHHNHAPSKPSDDPLERLVSGTHVWVGMDTYKSIGERITNINGGTGALTGSFGAVAGFNSGFNFGDSTFGVQAGASGGLYDPKGRIRLIPEDTEEEYQVFYTAGLYKRADMSSQDPAFFDRISLGVVYDGFHARHWGVNSNDINLSQVRGTIGVAFDDATEIGVWGTTPVDTDLAAVTVAGAPGVRREIRATNQLNAYVKHNFDFGGELMAYWGEFDDAAISSWQGGLVGRIPLSHHWATTAGANYVAPHRPSGPTGSGEEQFSASLGIVFYFGGNAPSSNIGGNPQQPLLDVASNLTFLVTD